MPLTLTAVGSLQSPETTTVSADVSGLVEALDIPEGKLVEKGHLLARLDAAVPRAAVRVAEARSNNAKAELERVTPLYEDGVVPRQTYDDAVAEMETAEGLLEEARTRLEKTRVRAPFTGVLSLRIAQIGQYVSSGDPIVQITKIDPLELVFTVPEADAGKIQPGQTVEGRIGGCGQAFTGIVEALDPRVDPSNRTLSVKARVPNTSRVLRPGMSARLRVIYGSRGGAVLVPREALVREGTRYLVYLVSEEVRIAPRDVVPGDFLVDRVEIRRGLEAGESVVVAGQQKLRPGMLVSPRPWQPVDNPLLRLGQSSDEDCL